MLSTTSVLFTFALAVLALGERFTLRKLAAVLCCMLGTCAVALADTDGSALGSEPRALEGDALTLASSCLYALYTAGLKRVLPDDDRVSMLAFLGYLGAWNGAVFGPLALALHLAGAMDVSAVTGTALATIVAKGLLDNVLSDYLWARAVLLVGPTMATSGLSIQTPVAIAADVLLGRAVWLEHARPSLYMLSGAVLSLAGFFGIVSETKEQYGR